MQVDKKLKDSCEDGGDYCNFHFWFIDYIKNLKYQDWFENYECVFDIRESTSDYVWNDETQQYELTKKKRIDDPMPSGDIILEVIRSIIWDMDLPGPVGNSAILAFQNKLEMFDYNAYLEEVYGEDYCDDDYDYGSSGSFYEYPQNFRRKRESDVTTETDETLLEETTSTAEESTTTTPSPVSRFNSLDKLKG